MSVNASDTSHSKASGTATRGLPITKKKSASTCFNHVSSCACLRSAYLWQLLIASAYLCGCIEVKNRSAAFGRAPVAINRKLCFRGCGCFSSRCCGCGRRTIVTNWEHQKAINRNFLRATVAVQIENRSAGPEQQRNRERCAVSERFQTIDVQQEPDAG